MKLIESSLFDLQRKRKLNTEDECQGFKRHRMCEPLIAADVIQDNLQREFLSHGVMSLSTSHCKKYPISGEPLDGICPKQPVTTAASCGAAAGVVRSPPKVGPCLRCLGGESGHWRHML
ncbi:uncharacterized protein LOC108671580 isoform X2 [Hyalella azteca]|uniref:Uncharacterized protein LOC108671580 isoform X2 n=1 Tax=Hyalella azteca TaxID=294128 RepID=A0A8B7NLT0_HYAAZ|nr:uncharacterized protein LOC108671580 isoform X2 [Hyalella azteca]